MAGYFKLTPLNQPATGGAKPTPVAPTTNSGSGYFKLPAMKTPSASNVVPTPAAPVIDPTIKAAATNVKPIKTDGLFSKVRANIQNMFGEKEKPQPMQFFVGEGMTPEGKTQAESKVYDVAAKQEEAGVSQTVKIPFMNKGFRIQPEGQGGAGGTVNSLIKAFVELPERATRTLGELVNLSKPTRDSGGYSIYGGNRPNKTFQVPSYAESAGKTTQELIDQGIPPTAAVILGSAQTSGSFANDALMYEGLLASGARSVATKSLVPAESHIVAYDFLGRPKTLAEAETNFKTIQREFHPDKMSGNSKMSAQANNSIAIIRKEGIPSTNKFKQGLDAIMNRPVTDLFKKGDIPKGTSPTTTIRGFLEDTNKSKPVSLQLKKEITEAIDKHGIDVTRQALQDNLGVDAETAMQLISKSQKPRAISEILKAVDKGGETVQNVATPTFKFDEKPAEKFVPHIEGAQTKYDTPKIVEARKAEVGVQTQDIQTPERAALREKVVKKMYGEGAPKKEKRIDIVTGGPGTRKSSMISAPLSKEHGSLVIDPDTVKLELPEYGKGEGAGVVHRESSLLAKDIRTMAMKNGDNIVISTVGHQEENIVKLIDMAHKHEYEIHLHNATLPLEKSIPGIVKRFESGEQGFVDPLYAQEVGLQPTHVHDKIKTDERIKSHTKYSTDVERGQKPKILESSSDKRPTKKPQGVDKSGGGDVPGTVQRRSDGERLSERAAELTKKNGGVTITLDGDIPTKGYSFAESKETEFVVSKEDWEKDADKYIDMYLEEHLAEFENGKQLGLWIDDGKVYHDVITVSDDLGEALQKADAANQIGIFDLEKFETINTKEGLKNYEQKSTSPDGNEKGRNEGGIQEENKGPVKKEAGLKSRVFERLKAENSELTGDLSYNEVNLKNDSEKAVDLLIADKNKAYRIAMGAEDAPEGQTSTAVNIAMAEKALEEGNNALYGQLVRNRSLAQTKRGQEIVAEKGSVTNNSTSRYVKELVSSRLENLGKKYLSGLDISKSKKGVSVTKKSNKMRATEMIEKEVKKVKQKINRTKELDLDEAQKLLDSLICK